MYKQSALQSGSLGGFPPRALFGDDSWGGAGLGVEPFDVTGHDFAQMNSVEVADLLQRLCEALPMDPPVGEPGLGLPMLASETPKPASGPQDLKFGSRKRGAGEELGAGEDGSVKRACLDRDTPMAEPHTPPRKMAFQVGLLPGVPQVASPVPVPTEKDARGPFEEGSPCGSGTYGTVRRVGARGLNFAKKTYRRCDPHKEICGELKAMGSVPEGIQALGVATREDTLLLPLAHGGDLYHLIKKLSEYAKTASEEEKGYLALLKTHWMYQLFCQLLLYQRAGLVHGDMKSGNVLVYSSLDISVADFPTTGPLAKSNHKLGTVVDLSQELLAQAMQECSQWPEDTPLPPLTEKLETYVFGKMGLELVLGFTDAGSFFAHDPKVQAFRHRVIQAYTLAPELAGRSWPRISDAVSKKEGPYVQKHVQLSYVRLLERCRQASPVPGPESTAQDQLIHLMLQCMALDPAERPDTPVVLARLNALYQLQLAELGLEDSLAVTQRCADVSRAVRDVKLP